MVASVDAVYAGIGASIPTQTLAEKLSDDQRAARRWTPIDPDDLCSEILVRHVSKQSIVLRCFGVGR
jgi:hypothetical protein